MGKEKDKAEPPVGFWLQYFGYTHCGWSFLSSPVYKAGVCGIAYGSFFLERGHKLPQAVN
jgi:hypothetical protein